MSTVDSRRNYLQELLGSRTLTQMLSSQNIEDVILAAGILDRAEGGSDVAEPVNELVILILETTVRLYNQVHSSVINQYSNNGTHIRSQDPRIKEAIEMLEGALTKLSRDTWIDPVTAFSERVMRFQAGNDEALEAAL